MLHSHRIMWKVLESASFGTVRNLLLSRSSSSNSAVSMDKNTFCSGDSSSFTSSSPLPLAFTSYESKIKKDITPLIIQHNLLGSRGNWTRFAKELNKITKGKVITVDCRNHGESPHSPHMNYTVMAKDIEFLASQQKLKKISFMGTGMSGRVGMALALDQPHLTNKLIVINSTPLDNPAITKRYSKIGRSCLLMEACREEILQAVGVVGKTSLADKVLSPVLTDSFDRSLFLTNLNTSSQPKSDEKMWRLNFEAIADNKELGRFPHYPEGTTFKGPTLFITGERCDYLKPSDEEQVRKLFPNAKFVWIPDSGYWMHLEKHVELLETLIPFLNEHDR